MSHLNELYQQIAAIGRRFGAHRIVLYGSRARGDYRERSDVDLAIYGLPPETRSSFQDAIEELPTLLSFDVIFMDDPLSPEFIQKVEKEGIDLMTKYNDKYSKFLSAVDRLQESILEYDDHPTETMRDGVIQRFEFCTELAWKTAREYLAEEGFVDLNSPRSVMREAYAFGLIDNDALWNDLLKDRNQTSHVYNQETARNIFARIRADYYQAFRALVERFQQK